MASKGRQEVNKTIVIAGGTAVVSLAAGAAGGYFFAKNKLGKAFDKRVDEEVENTKKYYSILLMEAKNQKPSLDDLLEDGEEEDEDLEEDDGEVSEEEVALAETAARALVDYQGYADVQKATPPVKNNVFDKKPKLPPRDPSGKFLPRQGQDNTPQDEQVPAPYIITQQEFYENEPGFDQENYRYYIEDETLLGYDTEAPLDIDRVGEENLKKFNWDLAQEEENIICVRNPAYEEDYEIHLTYDRITNVVFGPDAQVPPDPYL